MVGAQSKVAFVIQGPVHRDTNGYSTFEMLRRLGASAVRDRVYLVSVLWADESPTDIEQVRELVDEVVLAEKPAYKGAGHRNFQSTAVSAGLAALEGRGFRHVLKTRHDFLLPDVLVSHIVALADDDFEKIFVTNLYTKREAFHVSDMFLFSTFEHVKMWYDSRAVFYEDLYSAEVQFARCFVRNKQLPYPLSQWGYLRFLRDWVEMVDWAESGILWFKDPVVSRASVNSNNNIMRDRDCGAVMCKLLPADYPQYLRRTRLSLHLIATSQLVRDALTTLVLMQGGALLARLGMRPHYFEVPLPGGGVLDVKIGGSAKRYNVYHVDPDVREEVKPIGDVAPPLPRGRTHLPASGIRGRHGMFAIERRRGRAV